MANDDKFYPGEPNGLAWRIFVAHSATQVFQAGPSHPLVEGVCHRLLTPRLSVRSEPSSICSSISTSVAGMTPQP